MVALQRQVGKGKVDTSKTTQQETCRSGMQLASHIWPVGDDSNALEDQMPDTNDDDVNASLVAARASQRKEKSEPLSAPHEYTHLHIMADTDCSVIDIRNLLRDSCSRRPRQKKTNE